eukprot:Opistho-2@61474
MASSVTTLVRRVRCRELRSPSISVSRAARDSTASFAAAFASASCSVSSRRASSCSCASASSRDRSSANSRSRCCCSWAASPAPRALTRLRASSRSPSADLSRRSAFVRARRSLRASARASSSCPCSSSRFFSPASVSALAWSRCACTDSSSALRSRKSRSARESFVVASCAFSSFSSAAPSRRCFSACRSATSFFAFDVRVSSALTVASSSSFESLSILRIFSLVCRRAVASSRRDSSSFFSRSNRRTTLSSSPRADAPTCSCSCSSSSAMRSVSCAICCSRRARASASPGALWRWLADAPSGTGRAGGVSTVRSDGGGTDDSRRFGVVIGGCGAFASTRRSDMTDSLVNVKPTNGSWSPVNALLDAGRFTFSSGGTSSMSSKLLVSAALPISGKRGGAIA